MLRTVLASDDEKTVQLTIDRLPLEYIGPLINELSKLLQGKAARWVMQV